MVLWGTLLGFCYQLFLKQTEKSRSLWGAALLYLFAGLICFLLTALFLYFISGGNWGVYGLLAMVLGFFLYHQWFWQIGGRVSARSDRVAAVMGKTAISFGKKTTGVMIYPFGKIVDKGEKWIVKKEENRRKRRKEKNNNENPLP